MEGKKVVLVNTVYGSGSVGRIVADLYRTAVSDGMEAAAAYGRGSAPPDLHAYKIGSRTDFYRHVCYNFFRDGSGFGSAGRTERFLSWLEQEKPDLLHLHNLHGFYLQTEMLFSYIKRKRISVVWTLHDCWPFTGHCAYYDKNGCDRWERGCGSCRYHRSAYPYALFCDNSAGNYRRKQKAFCGVENLTVVTPSKWLAQEAGRSFLGEYPVRIIPNGVDTDLFRPACGTGDAKETAGFETDQRKAGEDRDTAGISSKGREAALEILGAANIWEERKGLAYLEELARIMPPAYHMTLVGLNDRQKKRIRKKFSEEKVSVKGRTDSIGELAEAYRKADVFVNPTLEDVFSMTNLEALACGTPVVTFPTGGSPETVSADSGIVTRTKDAAALLAAIERIRCARLRQDGNYTAQACRNQALRFQKKERCGEYLALYREMTAEGSGA